ncbi:Ger(x)C family spore germination protein [Clostridium sp. P21]|uniref:Ger(X)C family spore germination protein n=1 Tax=Clostridium muellerianum TaxID=2716538 RepID=A0A7Y0ELR9_9CLOT|nr:Ger(x)C family spore germination protein [Clostridium muellerianum]NMM65794.1 Ger(x)C family spore germination protein [Clostridium muellerianum]
MKKFTAIFMIILTLFSTTGCKGTKTEIENLAVVMATGYDQLPGNKYLLTVQVLNPQKSSSGASGKEKVGGSQSTADVIIYSDTGASPAEAIAHLSTRIGKNLFFAHSKYTVIGKGLAEAGLATLIDSLLRGYVTRPDIPILVTKGNATDIVSSITSDDTIPANTVYRLIRQQSIMGYAPVQTRMNFANKLSSKTSAPIAGVINVNKNIYGTFEMEGTAVFKNDKLIGFLNKNQTRGVQWINGKVKGGNLLVPSQNNKIISFEILGSSSKVEAIKKNDSVMMLISIKEKSNIREMTGKLDPMEDEKIMDEFSKFQNETIQKEVKEALFVAQKELKADIFDFGEIVHKTYPNEWDKIGENWQNIFPLIEVKIMVDSSLERPGTISKPVK